MPVKADDGVGDAIRSAFSSGVETDVQPSRDRSMIDRIAMHAVLHERCWRGFRPLRWRWPERWPSALLPVSVAAMFVLALIYRALVPEFAPGVLDIPQPVRDRAALLFVLCWLPAFHYLMQSHSRRRPVPFFAAYGCLYSGYYALSPMLGLANVTGLSGRPGLETFDAAVAYAAPVDLLLFGWILLAAGYWAAGAAPVRRHRVIDRYLKKVPDETIRNWAFGILMAGMFVEFVDRTTTGWPLRFQGIVHLVTTLSHSAIVVLIVLMRRGKLARPMAAAAVVGIIAAVFMELGGSATGRVMLVLFAVFMGAWIGSRSISARYIVAGLIIGAGCVAIRGVMSEWRAQVWVLEQGQTPPIQRSRKMLGLLDNQVDRYGVLGTVSRGWSAIAERSANIDLLVDVMYRTPARIPFWDGFTYRSLTGALVPRFLWPDKPSKTLGQDFGHRYGYLSVRDEDTSINLPVVVEFYINYGTAGVLLGMLALGVLLRMIDDLLNRPGQSLLLTAAAVPIVARLLIMECDLSLTFGGLPLQLPSALLLAVLMLWTAGVVPLRRPPEPPWYAPLGLR